MKCKMKFIKALTTVRLDTNINPPELVTFHSIAISQDNFC